MQLSWLPFIWHICQLANARDAETEKCKWSRTHILKKAHCNYFELKTYEALLPPRPLPRKARGSWPSCPRGSCRPWMMWSNTVLGLQPPVSSQVPVTASMFRCSACAVHPVTYIKVKLCAVDQASYNIGTHSGLEPGTSAGPQSRVVTTIYYRCTRSSIQNTILHNLVFLKTY